MLRKLGAGFDQALNVMRGIAVVFVIISFLTVCIDVLMRQVLDRPVTWAQEVIEYSIPLLAFFGAAWVLKVEGHVSIDLLVNLLKPRGGVILNAIMSFIGTIACFIVTWYSLLSTIDHAERGLRFVTTLKPLQWPFLLVIPLGFLMLSIQFLRRTYGFMKESRATPEEVTRTEIIDNKIGF
ncbi:MAG: TRAP transporter small permease [Chloroflexota bacterium]